MHIIRSVQKNAEVLYTIYSNSSEYKVKKYLKY